MSKVLKLVNGEPKMVAISVADTSIYNGQLNVASPITAGTSVTLPSSGTYNSTELNIFLNGARLYFTEDYTHVGSAPRTQVQFLFDLVVGDQLLFYREWNP